MNLHIILEQCPQCLEKSCKAIFHPARLVPQRRREINIVLDVYECGIADKIKHLKSIDALQL